jgi:molecular chaperone GrpE
MPERMKQENGDRRETEELEPQASSAVIEDLDALRSRLSALEEERDSYLALLQRTQADFDNYQKRIQRDLAQERRYACAPLVREELPVLDNLQRALAAARQAGEEGPLVQGVTMVQSQLAEILRRFGIVPINPQGQPFDPMQHESVLEEPRSDVDPGTVVRVLETGYRLHDRMLRPARVVVAAPAAR